MLMAGGGQGWHRSGSRGNVQKNRWNWVKRRDSRKMAYYINANYSQKNISSIQTLSSSARLLDRLSVDAPSWRVMKRLGAASSLDETPKFGIAAIILLLCFWHRQAYPLGLNASLPRCHDRAGGWPGLKETSMTANH
ncbi:hypothetical protein [Thiorhodovibrio winogradskyi]|uniref:hypothetical protein n=1 Tax=Thiorhodovibrio winogradskyi TaxID=77007 RepID=UPI002E2AB6F8|nr:hypothetical protein [Thiorhodovibrio winogradskyi]